MAKLTDRKKRAMESVMKDVALEAVVKVMLKEGIDGLTMDRVAAAADVAKGTLYNYFKDKDQMLLFVAKRVFEPIDAGLREILTSDGSALTKIERVLELFFVTVEGQRRILSELMAMKSQAHTKEGEAFKLERFASAVEAIAVIVKEGIKQKVFRKCDPQVVGETIFGAVVFSIEMQVASNTRREASESVSTLMDLFKHGLCVTG